MDIINRFWTLFYDWIGLYPKSVAEPPTISIEKVTTELGSRIGVEEWIFVVFVTFLVTLYLFKEIRNQRFCQDNKRELLILVDQKLTEKLAQFTPPKVILKDSEMQTDFVPVKIVKVLSLDEDEEVFSTPKVSPRTPGKSRIPTIKRNFGSRAQTELNLKLSDAGDPGITVVKSFPQTPVGSARN